MLAPVHNNEVRSAPLREWRTLTRAFVSAPQCENYKAQKSKEFTEHMIPGLPPQLEKLNARLYREGVCLASDDPRLKPN